MLSESIHFGLFLTLCAIGDFECGTTVQTIFKKISFAFLIFTDIGLHLLCIAWVKRRGVHVKMLWVTVNFCFCMIPHPRRCVSV